MSTFASLLLLASMVGLVAVLTIDAIRRHQ
jgi:hypothetical protein